jgi:hypothetical protein
MVNDLVHGVVLSLTALLRRWAMSVRWFSARKQHSAAYTSGKEQYSVPSEPIFSGAKCQ